MASYEEGKQMVPPAVAEDEPVAPSIDATQATRVQASGGANMIKFLLGLGVGLTIIAAIYFATAAPATPVAAPTGPVGENIGQVVGLVAESAPNTGLSVGQQAPDFSWKTVDGKEVRLSDMRGKAVMLNFFASWCGPCRAETPDLQALYQEKQAQGFVLLLVDGDPQDADKVNEYAQNFRLSMPLLSDPAGNVGKRYQVSGFPTNYFIDKDGIIRDVFPGSLARNDMLLKVSRLLK